MSKINCSNVNCFYCNDYICTNTKVSLSHTINTVYNCRQDYLRCNSYKPNNSSEDFNRASKNYMEYLERRGMNEDIRNI